MEDIYNAIVERNPENNIALYFDEGRPKHQTYDEFRNAVFKTASQLWGLFSGIAPNTVVGLKIKNSPRWPVMFWAILMSGHIPLLIDARLDVTSSPEAQLFIVVLNNYPHTILSFVRILPRYL